MKQYVTYLNKTKKSWKSLYLYSFKLVPFVLETFFFHFSVAVSEVRGQPSLDAWLDCLQAVCRERRSQGSKRHRENRGSRSEQGTHAIFTAFPSKRQSVNCNVHVGGFNLRPSRHAGLGLAWSWRLTQRCEIRGRDEEKGASRWASTGLNNEILSVPMFQFAVKPEITSSFFFFLNLVVVCITGRVSSTWKGYLLLWCYKCYSW